MVFFVGCSSLKARFKLDTTGPPLVGAGETAHHFPAVRLLRTQFPL